MAANTGQGRNFAVFIVGMTVACVGIAAYSTGMGKAVMAVGIVILLLSLFGFMKIKPLEGKPAMRPAPLTMKLAGAFASAFGWFITLYGIHLVPGVSGRIVLSLIGIAVSLFGLIYILPAAFNKNAIWKTQG